jgi:hypothetical protein
VGYSVQGKLEVSIFINGTEFPLDTMNTLNFMHITWWTRGMLPLCHFGVFDARHSLDNIELQDGIPIRIVIKPLSSPSVTYNFRKFDHKKFFNGTGFEYTVDGYLDYPLYWAGTSNGGIRGTSTDVLSQIASRCGLKFNGVTTNDSQLWMQRNRTYGEFALQIKRRGYASDSSYMELGVNPDGTMSYVDVQSLPDPTQTVVLGQYMQGGITAVDYVPHASSGLPNKMTGYQNTRFDQSIVGSSLSSPNSQVSFTPDSKSPLFNTTIQSTIARGYQSYGGLDVGNVHANYEKAIYQNRRFANTYSLSVEFLIQTPTTFRLFDTFTFSVDQEVNKQDVAFAGIYTVAGKTLAITGAQYSEKILGVRNGTNLPYTTG